jgi:hypothetical protein
MQTMPTEADEDGVSTDPVDRQQDEVTTKERRKPVPALVVHPQVQYLRDLVAALNGGEFEGKLAGSFAELFRALEAAGRAEDKPKGGSVTITISAQFHRETFDVVAEHKVTLPKPKKARLLMYAGGPNGLPALRSPRQMDAFEAPASDRPVTMRMPPESGIGIVR